LLPARDALPAALPWDVVEQLRRLPAPAAQMPLTMLARLWLPALAADPCLKATGDVLLWSTKYEQPNTELLIP